MGFGAYFDESNIASIIVQPRDSEKLGTELEPSVFVSAAVPATELQVVGVDSAQNCIRC